MSAEPKEVEMAESRQIAGLVGPILVVVTLSEIVNPRVWDTVSAPDTYQAGLLAFVAGFSIVRAHNRWTAGWPVVLTMVGWFGVVAGIGRMFATQMALNSAANPSTAMALEVLLLAIGLFLSFKAFGKTPGGATEA
jgi:hypothetical protein